MNDGTWKLLIFITLLVVEVALIVRLFSAPPDQAGILIGAVVAIAAAMALAPRLFDLLSIELPGVSAQLRDVQVNVDEAKRSAAKADENLSNVNAKLDALFALSLSDWQYVNLEKIASGQYGKYVRSLGLESDLRHLRSHGYIDIPSVRDIPPAGEELCDFVRVTDTGRLFVQLRRRLDIPNPVLLKQTSLAPSTSLGRSGDVEQRGLASELHDGGREGPSLGR